ncbi:hypothetical protein F0562_031586 [Nyssa sinensis]|uniref:Uncharacterized protein n=1 Tax=Nyssa sinensis TaxID=561372 RepID=A0A5J5AZ15_9ASTE|nr:hypothetical protein F0562_031586 [Nyssa sinensis]
MGSAKEEKTDDIAVHKNARRRRLEAALPLLKNSSTPDPENTDFRSIVPPKPAAAPVAKPYLVGIEVKLTKSVTTKALPGADLEDGENNL